MLSNNFNIGTKYIVCTAFYFLGICCNQSDTKETVVKDNNGRIIKKITSFHDTYGYDPAPDKIDIAFYDTLGRETELRSMMRDNDRCAWEQSITFSKYTSNQEGIDVTYDLGYRNDTTDWTIKPDSHRSLIVYEMYQGSTEPPVSISVKYKYIDRLFYPIRYEKDWPVNTPGVAGAKESIWDDSTRQYKLKIVSDTSIVGQQLILR